MDESHLKKTKSYWKSLDLAELIKELEYRGQVIEPPVSASKAINGKAVKEKVGHAPKTYVLDRYFNDS